MYYIQQDDKILLFDEDKQKERRLIWLAVAKRKNVNKDVNC